MGLIEHLQDVSYIQLTILSFVYFLFLYFVVGYLFLKVCIILQRRGFLNKIVTSESTPRQTQSEIYHSIKSIFIFGLSGLPILALYRLHVITFLPDTLWNSVAGILILTLWNEIHFYLVHRFMHIPFMMQHIHVIHHRSIIPSVYSVYSFHWVEALLLSTVPICILPFISLNILSVILFPLVSILFNFSGHCNYRFGNGSGNKWKVFGTRHAEHHKKGKKTYGFILPLFHNSTKITDK